MTFGIGQAKTVWEAIQTANSLLTLRLECSRFLLVRLGNVVFERMRARRNRGQPWATTSHETDTRCKCVGNVFKRPSSMKPQKNRGYPSPASV